MTSHPQFFTLRGQYFEFPMAEATRIGGWGCACFSTGSCSLTTDPRSMLLINPPRQKKERQKKKTLPRLEFDQHNEARQTIHHTIHCLDGRQKKNTGFM